MRRQLKKSSLHKRKFRIDICKEIHRYHHEQFNEQTGHDRFYYACGDMFEAAPEYVLDTTWNVKGGIISEFDETKIYLQNKPRRDKLNRILK